jgi:para-nitrobenzyl esterase
MPQYNGTHYAQAGLVLVTINYRLGPFGQLAWSEFATEDPTFPSTGGMNFLTDQIMALRFIKNEISSFGGDPNHVTVFGESAGSVSVCCLLSSALSRGLYHAAVMQSGPCTGPWGPGSNLTGLASSSALLTSLWASSPGHLRNMSARDILDNEWSTSVYPSIDGVMLTKPPSGNLNPNRTVAHC